MSGNFFRQPGMHIVAALFVCLGLLYGIWYSYAVFLVALIEEFGWSRSVTAGAMSVFILVHGFFGPVAGRLVEHFGARRLIVGGALLMTVGLAITSQISNWWQLYLGFGVLTAIGLGACGWVPTVVLMGKWFPHKIGSALGIVTAGIGVGILGLVPLVNLLIETYGWRAAFLILALLVLVVVTPIAVYVLHDPHALPGKNQEGDGAAAIDNSSATDVATGDWTVGSAVRSRGFRFVALAFFTGATISQMLLMHQFAFMVDRGVDKMLASMIGGLIGFVSVPAKIMWGTLSDRLGREVTYTLGLTCVFLSVVALALVARVPGLLMPFIFAAFVGLGYSVHAPLIPAVARDMFAGPRFPTIFGTISVFSSLGGATGAWLGGALHDLFGNYSPMLVLAASLALIAPWLLWIAAPRRPERPPVAVLSELT